MSQDEITVWMVINAMPTKRSKIFFCLINLILQSIELQVGGRFRKRICFIKTSNKYI